MSYRTNPHRTRFYNLPCQFASKHRVFPLGIRGAYSLFRRVVIPKKRQGSLIRRVFIPKGHYSVNHNIAIEKLSALEVRGAIVPWICSFLNNRRQCVRYNQTLSDYAVLTAGVPQGTELGPITFQIVINDAACNSNTSCWNYVDDLAFAENPLCKEDSKMQADLDDFLEWSELRIKTPGVTPGRNQT